MLRSASSAVDGLLWRSSTGDELADGAGRTQHFWMGEVSCEIGIQTDLASACHVDGIDAAALGNEIFECAVAVAVCGARQLPKKRCCNMSSEHFRRKVRV